MVNVTIYSTMDPSWDMEMIDPRWSPITEQSGLRMVGFFVSFVRLT